jgi:glyoxylate utilization-related uncharacterized protein
MLNGMPPILDIVIMSEILFIFLIEGQMGVQYHGREQCLSKGNLFFMTPSSRMICI